MATTGAIGELLACRLAELDIDIADVPLAESFVGETISQLETQLSLVIYQEGISQIRGVAAVVIIVAVVAEEGTHSTTFPIERTHAEGIALVDLRLGKGRVEERL